MVKAVALVSGGLDSLLAAKLILDQGITVVGLNFFTGFTGEGSTVVNRHHNISRPLSKLACSEEVKEGSERKPGACTLVREESSTEPTHELSEEVVLQQRFGASWVAQQLGIELHIVDVVAKFQQVLLDPKYGYGTNLNPCLDCKLFMVQQAKLWMEENGFDFLITGEVLGQRPMSQRAETLPIVAKNTDDLLLRPLCAKLLPITAPERNGWVNRELLCDFSGRSRKPQIELAAKFGFTEYPQPAGGCCLTEGNYCSRLQDLWNSKGRVVHDLDAILLLKVGRHVRWRSDLKFIIGRDALENDFLLRYREKFIWAQCVDFPGAIVLLDGKCTVVDYQLLAKFAAYFSKGRQSRNVQVGINLPHDSTEMVVIVDPLTEGELAQLKYM